MPLADDPFDYEITKDDRVRVFRGGRLVATVAGRDALRLIPRLGHDDARDQLELARVTGNYKRGNERR